MQLSQPNLTVHPVLDGHGDHVPDLCVVELFIPAVDSEQPFFTGGGEANTNTSRFIGT